MPGPPVFVCRKCKGSAELVEALRERTDADLRLVRCQDICKGAVVGLDVAGTTTWFKRIRSPKARKGVAKLVGRADTGPIPKRLAAHHVAKRDGRRVRGANRSVT